MKYRQLHILIGVIAVNRKNLKIYAAWILLAEAVGGLSGWLSRAGMKNYEAAAVKPPLSPPGFLFPIV